jgi:gamma-glutamylcyclotransferase (GGCT)/AIG2-like uncharacterized protein YtfP
MIYTNDFKALTDIVHNLNRAENEKYFVDKCEKMFSSLESIIGLYIDYSIKENKLSDFAKKQLEANRLSINNKFSETVNSILKSSEKSNLINSKAFKEIIYYTPLIMSDAVLEHKRYNPDDISEELREKASITHKRLIDNYNSPRRRDDIIITSLCKLLYEVRSNMKHCGKTPYGPDQDKSKRDEEICKLIHPTLSEIINILLENPNDKLLLYGTLKTGKSNSSILDNYRNNLKNVSIWGFIEMENNLPYYTFSISSSQNEIQAELIYNNELNTHFDKLDEFEGTTYRRIKVPFKNENEVEIGQVYEKNVV